MACTHQLGTSELSKWGEKVKSAASANQDQDQDEAILTHNLRVKLSQLSGLIHEKRDSFAWDELRRHYSYYDLAMKTVRFEFMVSTIYLTHPEDISMAYNLFQRAALALEVVRVDMDHHKDMTVRTSIMWQQVEDIVGGILEHLQWRSSMLHWLGREMSWREMCSHKSSDASKIPCPEISGTFSSCGISLRLPPSLANQE